MTARYLSPTNSFLPVPTGQVIAYVRRPEDFKMNRYVQIVNSPAPLGIYYELDRDQPVRVVSVAETAWEDGSLRPTGHHNLSNFNIQDFRCKREAIPFTLGLEAVENARKHGGWDPVSYESMQTASQAMTLRLRNLMVVLETSGNYSGNTDTATNLGGARWDVGTSTAPYLKKGLMKAGQAIHKGTNGRAKLTELKFVIHPDDAIKMAASPEIHDYVKNNTASLGYIKNNLDNPNELYGLPSHLYGIEVVVEDGMYVSTRPVAAATAGTRAYAKTAGTGILVYRPGGLDGVYGTKSFSSIQMFYHKYEMAVETRTDDWNKLIEGSVVDEYVFKMVAPATAYYVTAMTT